MIPWWVLAIMVFGTNFTVWGLVGLLRLCDSSARRPFAWLWSRLRRRKRTASADEVTVARSGGKHRYVRPTGLTLSQLAVLIPAHNEELVLEESLRAITALVPPENVHVVSDASTDRTVELARRAGVHVTTTTSNVGKAGALQQAIRRFRLVSRYRLVMLLDADTRVEPGYFRAALPLFDDPRVVAVAGCVRTSWRGRDLSAVGRLVAFHRQRIYAVTQYLLKFGQTWRRVNATHIVPGFASLYRTDVLPYIEVNPPGLVIEDFNMTFEVYQKRLGKVGFTPNAVAQTQDPGTLRDYARQAKRWSLGLWQTVRLHPPRFNLFTAMLAVLLLELLTSSVMMLLLPLVVLVLLVPELFGAVLAVPVLAEVHGSTLAVVNLWTLLFGVVLPDLALTCGVALFQRQPRYLLFGWFFLPLRVLDAAIALYALPFAWLSKSNGRWRSPVRRAVATPAEPETGAPHATAS